MYDEGVVHSAGEVLRAAERPLGGDGGRPLLPDPGKGGQGGHRHGVDVERAGNARYRAEAPAGDGDIVAPAELYLVRNSDQQGVRPCLAAEGYVPVVKLGHNAPEDGSCGHHALQHGAVDLLADCFLEFLEPLLVHFDIERPAGRYDLADVDPPQQEPFVADPPQQPEVHLIGGGGLAVQPADDVDPREYLRHPALSPLSADAVDQTDGLEDAFGGRVEVVEAGDLRIGRFEPEGEDIAGGAGVREDADDLFRFLRVR